jgi:triose/dihydroxyacetone kinase / FAD-AMP lyase (cyclizing)
MMWELGGRWVARLGGEVGVYFSQTEKMLNLCRHCWNVSCPQDCGSTGGNRVRISGTLLYKADIFRASLEDVAKTAKLVALNIVSVGASLSHVHVPGRDVTESKDEGLKEGEVEVGMGIHNEQGSERASLELVPLVKKMLAQMLDPSDKDRNFLTVSKEDKVFLLINNLGGLSPLELGGITTEVCEQLAGDYGLMPVRVLAGTFMTSLNGLGFSISLLKIVDTGLGQGRSMLDLLHAPSEAVGWPSCVRPSTWDTQCAPSQDVKDTKEEIESPPSNIKGKGCTNGLD